MKTIESWVLRVTDADACWYGCNWMRPAKTMHIGFWRIVFSSLLLGQPGFLLGVGMIYWVFGRVSWQTALLFFGLAFFTELLLHWFWAKVWNRRAAALRKHFG